MKNANHHLYSQNASVVQTMILLKIKRKAGFSSLKMHCRLLVEHFSILKCDKMVKCFIRTMKRAIIQDEKLISIRILFNEISTQNSFKLVHSYLLHSFLEIIHFSTLDCFLLWRIFVSNHVPKSFHIHDSFQSPVKKQLIKFEHVFGGTLSFQS